MMTPDRSTQTTETVKPISQLNDKSWNLQQLQAASDNM